MPAMMKSQLQSNLGQDSRKSLSEHSATSISSAFDPEKLYNNSTLLQKLEAEARPPVDKGV